MTHFTLQATRLNISSNADNLVINKQIRKPLILLFFITINTGYFRVSLNQNIH